MIRRVTTSGVLLLVGLPLLLAQTGPVLANALHEVQHVCACPIDEDGHCRCIACWQLDVHGERAAGREPEQGSPVPVVSSRCGDPLWPPPLLPVDPAAVGSPLPTSRPPCPRALPRAGPAAAPVAPDLPRLDRPPART